MKLRQFASRLRPGGRLDPDADGGGPLRFGIDPLIRLLLFANIAFVAILLGAMAVASFGAPRPGHPVQTDATEPSPATSGSTMQMGLAHIPTSNSCLLCHETGGEAGLKPVPAIGHQLAGWTKCLVCHTDEKLGRTAPGHKGIAEAECINCHKVAQPGPAITQAHSNLGKPCLDCHGKVAHLPTSMVGRNQDECWLCHKPASSPPPQEPHPPQLASSCRSCHQSADVGALPIDHALRGDDTCVLCHELKLRSPEPSVGAPPGG
jgi:hypothetical protein